MSIVSDVEDATAPPNRCQQIIDTAIQDHDSDPGALFEHDVIGALAELQDEQPAQWQRIRSELKKLKGLQIGAIERLIRQRSGDSADDTPSSQADLLVTLCLEAAVLFHDSRREAYAEIELTDHTEVWPVDSRFFRDWLSGLLYRELGKAARQNAMTDALAAISAAAIHEGDCREVYLRTAQCHDGYLIDLCDERWRVIEVTKTSWRILNKSPVPFRRTATMGPLPEPAQNAGNTECLWKYANVPEESRLLVVTWLIEAFRPNTPYALLEISAEQGSAKSSTQERLRQLVDPNLNNLRAAPKTTEDIFVAANSNHIVSYNNLSHVSSERQDALCTLCTGGGYAARKLYTDADETSLDVKRPVILNGINPVVLAPDLLDRTIRVELPKLDRYTAEAELEAQWSHDAGVIFGGLLDLFAQALKKLPKVHIEKPPRMADFAVLGEAVAAAYREDYQPGMFLDAYSTNRKEAVRHVIESSPVALAIVSLLNSHWQGKFRGTFQELYNELSDHKQASEQAWPKSPRGLGDKLRTLAPILRVNGLEIEFEGRGSRGRIVSLFFPQSGKGRNTRAQHAQRTQSEQESGNSERCVHRERQIRTLSPERKETKAAVNDPHPPQEAIL